MEQISPALQANPRRTVADTSQSVQCMWRRTVWSLACFVGMSWRAETSDNQMTVSSRQSERMSKDRRSATANASTLMWQRNVTRTSRPIVTVICEFLNRETGQKRTLRL